MGDLDRLGSDRKKRARQTYTHEFLLKERKSKLLNTISLDYNLQHPENVH